MAERRRRRLRQRPSFIADAQAAADAVGTERNGADASSSSGNSAGFARRLGIAR
jgi:hypothetical protein